MHVLFWFVITGVWKSKPADGKLVRLRNKSDDFNLKLKIDNNGNLLIIDDEEEKETEEGWTLPQENTIGLIEHSSGQVLSIDTTNGAEVVLKPRNNSDDQFWFRGQSNKNGYFILKHQKTGRCLTIDKDMNLTTGQFSISF